MKLRFLFFALLVLGFGVESYGQVNIIPIRTDVTGFPTWTDTNVAGSAYLQLLVAGANTTTPAMDFDGFTNETLDFKARTFGGTTAAEIILTVSISTDNGVTWAVLGTRTPASSTLLAQTQFDLSAFSGTQVKIKFSVAGTDNAIGVGIDDISIKGVVFCPTTAPTGLITGTTPACDATILTHTEPTPQTFWQTSSTGTLNTLPTTTPLNVTSSGTYYVRAFNGTCWSSAVLTSAPIVVNPTPAEPTTANPAPVCQGTPVTITGAGGATSYTFWNAATGGTKYTNGTYTVTATALTTPVTLAAGTYTFYVQGENANCVSATRRAVIVTVDAIPGAPVGSFGGFANPSCGPVTLTYTAGYYFQSTATGISTANPTSGTYTLNASGTVSVRSYNGICWGPSVDTGNITISTLPNLTSQPANSVKTIPNPGSFVITVTGNGLSYQWQVSTDGSTWNNVTDGTGANTATYTTAATTEAMNGYRYRVIVSNVCGSVTSNGAGTLVLSNTAPGNVGGLVVCATGNTTMSVSWNAVTGADGYVVFANTTAPTGTKNVANTYNTANSDYSLSAVTTPATLGKVLYKGAGLNVAVSGLVENTTYYYSVFAYKGESLTGWSGTGATAIRIAQDDVTNLVATSTGPTNTRLNWTSPVSGCYDQILVVANQGAVVFTPSGSTYTANATYSTSNQVVFSAATGTTVFVSGLTVDTQYCYKVFVRKGSVWSDGVSVCFTPTYCTAAGNTDDDTGITGVIFNTINNSSTGGSSPTVGFAYTNFTSVSTSVNIGQSYDLSVRANTAGNYEVTARVWIDWNKDGAFATAEMYELGTANNVTDAATSESPLSIEVPSNAVVGSTRMRVFVKSDSVSPNPTACENDASYGEVEDYTINVFRPVNAEIEVVGAQIIASGSTVPSSLEGTLWAALNIGATATTKSFTVKNLGLSNLSLGGVPTVSIIGAAPADFSVTVQPATSVASLGSTSFTISFHPQTTGLRTAVVSIANNDPTGSENPYTFTISGTGNCPSSVSSTILPVQGPVNTEVSITSPSNLTGATAKLNNLILPIVSTTAGLLVVKIPAGAVTGNLIVTLNTGCASTNTFTVIDNAITGCDVVPNSTIPGNLFFSEVTDATSGSSTYVEIFNGTGSVVNLSGYSLRVFNNGASTPNGTYNLTGTVAVNGRFVVSLGTTTCTPLPASSVINQTFSNAGGVNFKNNEADMIGLYSGSTRIDAFGVFQSETWSNGLSFGTNGVDFKRKNTATPLPNPNFVITDWDIVDWTSCADSDYSGLGTYDFSTGVPPVVSIQPQFAGTCSSTYTLTVQGAEGVAGGLGLTYQWYELAPSASTFALIPGATSSTYAVNTANSGYQYYVQVRENGATCYKASNATKVINTGTMWNGTVWSNGIPDATKAVTLSGNYNTAPLANGSFSCCTLTVTSGTLTIAGDSYVSVTNEVKNTGGTIDIKNNGTLIQVTDVNNATANANVGTVKMERITKPMYRFDYTYWSSPMTLASNYSLNSVSPGTLSDKFFKWEHTNQSWTTITNGAEVMVPARGYIVRAPQSFSADYTVTVPYTANFTGVPNNGIVTIPVSGNTATVPANYLYNLIGNPYPSAVSADEFLKNSNNPNLDATIYLWTHSTRISATPNANGQYIYNNADYATYNFTGATATGFGTAAATGGEVPSGFIASGQSFFIRGLANGTALFNNTMRVTDKNKQFYRVAEETKSRIWLNLTNAAGDFSQSLVGYVADATNAVERGYDGEVFGGNSLRFYSIAEDKKLTIQGRALPFDDSDIVPLGMKVLAAGTYKIEIANTDGLFDNGDMPVYLEDQMLNVIHNLRASAYEFNSTVGVIDDRFVLRYTNETLGVKTNVDNQKSVKVAVDKGVISVVSSKEAISSILLYDVVGRQIGNQQNINAFSTSIYSIVKDQSVIIKIVLVNGEIISKKLVL